MKKYLLSVFLFLLIITVCGAPPESEKPEHKAEGVYYQPLSAAELQKFLKAFPIFKTEAERTSMEWEKLDSPKHFGQWLDKLSIAAKDIADIDTKLKDAGMPWDEFWPAYGKTIVAFNAVMYDSAMVDMKKELEEEDDEIAELEARLKDPNTSAQEKDIIVASLDMRRRMKERLKEAEDVYTNVPQSNKALVKKHLQDLMTLFSR